MLRYCHTFIMGMAVRKGPLFNDRNWNKRPLFGTPRRRYGHWWLLLALLLAGLLLFLFPNLVDALYLTLIR